VILLRGTAVGAAPQWALQPFSAEAMRRGQTLICESAACRANKG
jgi:hypothetical protein